MTEREIVLNDLEAIYIGNIFTIEADLDLPLRGKLGSDITWKSSFPFILDEAGKVTRPRTGTGNREVVLTATAKYGSAEESRQFDCTVLEKDSEVVIKTVRPLRVTIPEKTAYTLPGVAIIDKEDGVCSTTLVKWIDPPDFAALPLGEYTVQGEPLPRFPEMIPVAYVTIAAAAEKPPMREIKASPFPLDSITLSPGFFDDNRRRFEENLLNTDDDRMLYNFRDAAGLDTKGVTPLTGWDAPECLLKGHTSGHYLSALALAAGGNSENKAKFAGKLNYMVSELAACQDAMERSGSFSPGFLSGYSEEQFDKLEKYVVYPKIWAPYYTLHKIFAGLLDCYEFAGNNQALEIAKKLGIWVDNRLSRLTSEQLAKMWSMYIAGEFGGMNEVLARLNKLSPNPQYLHAAKLFDNERLFMPMAENVDTLGDIHANQHVPQIIGALEIYSQTGDDTYYSIAKNFWEFVTSAHLFNIGGVGEGEMFKAPGKVATILTDKNAESCVSYNMLKLTRMLFAYEPCGRYMDYYEKTLYNHIAASGDPKEPSGGSTYFMPLMPGARKHFGAKENSCCHGTGLENHVKYQESIYFKQDNSVFVNLYIPSVLNWEEKSVTITQSGNFLEEQSAKFSIKSDSTKRFVLRFRLPFWLASPAVIRINGNVAAYENRNGYAIIDREFADGDSIDVKLPFCLRLETAPDDSSVACLYYGPLVLVIEDEQTEFITLPKDKILTELKPIGSGLGFEGFGYKFVPNYMAFDVAYHAYFKVN